jgi:O-antigen ligase
MPDATLRGSTVDSADRLGLLPLLLILGLAALTSVAGPEYLTMSLVAVVGSVIIAVRPQWGVALIMFLLMVQYGSRRYEREGVAGGLASIVPQGSGLLTINNLLGLFLVLLLVYHVYRDGDWSFLKSRPLRLVLAITAVLVFSAFISGIGASEQASIGLESTSAQDPSRQLVSRALFLVLFVFFLRKPSDLRVIVTVFVALAVITAWSGSSAALTGAGRLQSSEYRAGGLDVLIQSTKNPNRLALIATLGLVYIWEYSQAYRLQNWRRGLAMIAVLMMIVTVFLTASRGGLIGLVFTGLILFVRRRGGSGRLLYAFAVIALGAVVVQEVVPPEAMERITNIPGIAKPDYGGNMPGAGSTERREYTYWIGLQIWKKAPIVGVGPGNWPYVRFITDPLRSSAVAHNSYLAALAEGGLLTLMLYLVLFYTTIRDLLRCEGSPRIAAQAKADGLDWIMVSTRICLIAFMVFSLFSDLWDLVFSYFLFGVAAVIIHRYRPTAPALARA